MTKQTRRAKDTDSIEENLQGDGLALRFIATSSNQKWLLQKEHDINSLTGQLFAPKKEEEEKPEEEEEGSKAKSKTIYYDEDSPELQPVLTEEDRDSFTELFVPEVIANDKVKFWGVPKSGSF